MLTLDRDRLIVQSVSEFGQLAAGHLRSMHFHDLASPTPLDRALTRLVKRKYLSRIERRTVGGSGAGSGQYVYQLGSAGWSFMAREKGYHPFSSVHYHKLAVADAYVELLELERAGRIVITNYKTEPESHTTAGGITVRPDLYVLVEHPFKELRVPLWIEIDMGTERQSVLRVKMNDYIKFWQEASPEQFEARSIILFLAHTDMRAKIISEIINSMPDEFGKMFFSSTVPHFTGYLFP